jgi:predicted ATPase/class 3 adenylate cyclase
VGSNPTPAVMSDQPAGTVTLVFTDIEGSTRLLAELGEDGYRHALAEHRRVVREAFQRHDGYEVDEEGDAFFYAFASATSAAAAVQQAQGALASGPIRIRIGIHTGEPVLDPPKYVGLDVHKAARVMSAGHGGQVVLSQTTADLIAKDFALRDLGEHRLKDLSAPERLYQLGDSDFPRLKTLYQANLPVTATPFLGRTAELEAVTKLIGGDGARLVVLTGPGGTGKTRLALQAAAEVAEHFPAGLWWVSLSPLRDPALVIPAVAKALDVRELPGTDLAETVAAAIAGKRLLLLLDNAEHLLPDVADVIARLRAVDGPILVVTSRERLQLAGEQAYPVPPMVADDGVALFAARASSLDPAFELTPAVGELCSRLDNLPLAIELAAARTVALSPAQILERISKRLDLLKGGRDADPRQQTLRATIEWSHQLLGPEEQSLFARLSVFSGGCTLDAAEKVLDADIDTLESLVDKSLLRYSSNRFWMLETIREYAAEQLAGAGESDELRRRHASYFTELAEEAEPELWGTEQETWAKRLDLEHDNLRTALSWAFATNSPDDALRLAGALEPYWETRGLIAEGRRWLAEALAAGGKVSPAIRAKALFGASRLVGVQGELEGERTLLEEAVGLYREAHEPHGLTFALAHLGHTLAYLGQAERARAVSEEAVSTARALGDDWLIAMALNNFAVVWLEAGELAEARLLAEESLGLRRGLGEKRGIAVTLTTIAEIALAEGEIGQATEALEEGLTLLREIGNVILETLTLDELGLAALYAGDRERAQAHFRESLGLCREIGERISIEECFAGLAAIAALDGNAARSARLWGAAEALRVAAGIEPSPATRRLHEEFLPQFRSDTDAELVAREWAEGGSWTLERAMAYALEEID